MAPVRKMTKPAEEAREAVGKLAGNVHSSLHEWTTPTPRLPRSQSSPYPVSSAAGGATDPPVYMHARALVSTGRMSAHGRVPICSRAGKRTGHWQPGPMPAAEITALGSSLAQRRHAHSNMKKPHPSRLALGHL